MPAVDPASVAAADGGRYHCEPGAPACCLNTVVSSGPTAPSRSTVSVHRAVRPGVHCCPYYCAHWQQVRKDSSGVTVLWPMWVLLEPSWRLVASDPERHQADGRVQAQPALLNDCHSEHACFLHPWMTSSMMAAGGTEAAADVVAAAADVATTEGVVVDPTAGGADAQL